MGNSTQSDVLNASPDHKAAMIARTLEDFTSAWFAAIALEARALGKPEPPVLEDAFYAMFFGAADSLRQAIGGDPQITLRGIRQFMLSKNMSQEEFAQILRCQSSPALREWLAKGGNVIHRCLIEKIKPQIALQPIAAQYCKQFC